MWKLERDLSRESCASVRARTRLRLPPSVASCQASAGGGDSDEVCGVLASRWDDRAAARSQSPTTLDAYYSQAAEKAALEKDKLERVRVSPKLASRRLARTSEPTIAVEEPPPARRQRPPSRGPRLKKTPSFRDDNSGETGAKTSSAPPVAVAAHLPIGPASSSQQARARVAAAAANNDDDDWCSGRHAKQLNAKPASLQQHRHDSDQQQPDAKHQPFPNANKLERCGSAGSFATDSEHAPEEDERHHDPEADGFAAIDEPNTRQTQAASTYRI